MTVDPAAYTITVNKIIEPNVRLIRVHPTDLNITLGYILRALSSLCWIGKMSEELRIGYEVRAQGTVETLHREFTEGTNEEIKRNTGELLVSELSRSSIVDSLHYMDIPIGELFKQKRKNNHGFDVFTVNLNGQLLFGEAKYEKDANAYNSSFEQITRFIREKRDQSDLPDLVPFNIGEAIRKASRGERGFIAGFSSTTINDDVLERHIMRNAYYKLAPKDVELICVAVDVQ